MATIKVIAKIGDTYHPKYGELVKGHEYEIDEADFGDEIFEKGTGLSPKQKKDKEQNKEE